MLQKKKKKETGLLEAIDYSRRAQLYASEKDGEEAGRQPKRYQVEAGLLLYIYPFLSFFISKSWLYASLTSRMT